VFQVHHLVASDLRRSVSDPSSNERDKQVEGQERPGPVDLPGPVFPADISNAVVAAVATAAFVPFVQAMAQAFGTRLANNIGPWTRVRLRRFMRRQTRESLRGWVPRGAPVAPGLVLNHESGARILLDAHTPPTALSQLTSMDFGRLEGGSATTVQWNGSQWRASLVTLDGGAFASLDLLWDAGQREWTDFLVRPPINPSDERDES
jgi:hypothetical protein